MILKFKFLCLYDIKILIESKAFPEFEPYPTSPSTICRRCKTQFEPQLVKDFKLLYWRKEGTLMT